jgi:Ig-like domain from next to BRCA1 gene
MKMKIFITGFYVLLFSALTNAQIKSQQECVFDGQFSSSNISMPDEMYPDQKGEVVITLKNVGTCTWHPQDVELRVKIKKGPSGSPIQRDELLPSSSETLYPSTTKPNESATVRYKIEAPYYLGPYELEFVLMFKGTKFGELGVTKTVKIVPKK